MTTRPPLAFLSYANQDDAHEGGKLRRFAERLSGEVQLHLGEEFPIFVDRNNVKWGEEWQARIKESLSRTTFLIPILTPGYFKREWCRMEFLLFLERERALNRRDLILPVYYVNCPVLEDPTKGTQDELVQILRARQRKDCRNLRRVAWTKPEVTRQFEEMALEIVSALERTESPSPLGPQTASKGPSIASREKLAEDGVGNAGLAPARSESFPHEPQQPVIALPVGDPVNAQAVAEHRSTHMVPKRATVKFEVAPQETQIGTPGPELPEMIAEFTPTANGELAKTVAPSPAEIRQPLPEPLQGNTKAAFAESIGYDRQGQRQTWLERPDQAGKGEDGTALYNLGMMHELGLGVPVDLARARECYIRAARKRQGDAMNSLGLLYEQGEGVIAPNTEKARVWFRLAARYKSAEALENLKRLPS